jgi:hypothetical protein
MGLEQHELHADVQVAGDLQRGRMRRHLRRQLL